MKNKLHEKTQGYIDYVKAFNDNKKVVLWCETTLNKYLLKNSPTIEEVEHILDYLNSDKAPKLMGKVSYEQALGKAYEWSELLQKLAGKIKEGKDDTKIVLDFKDGFKVVQLIGKNAYEREGNLMRSCVSSYFGKDKKIYSLRDKFNNPHCTMEQNQQIKGKGNGDISPKYINYVVKFLEWAGMKVRDSEMIHLGYDVVPFAEYCETKLYRDRYIRKGQTIKYSDKVIIFDSIEKLKEYKGKKICLFRGNLSITSNTTLPTLKSVGGELCIDSSATLPTLMSVGGNLYINSSATLPNLKSVGGYLFINSSAALKADNLKSVGGDLSINSNATLPNLKSVGGDLHIHSSTTLPTLMSVGGELSIHSSATLPNLKSVGGYLFINSSAALKADNLKSVGGDLSINSSTTLPTLMSVGGYLFIDSDSTLNGNKVTEDIRKTIKIKGDIIFK